MKPVRLAVLLSGGGTTLQNIIDHIEAGKLDAEIAVVIASRQDAFGLERARRHNIPAVAVPRKKYAGAFNEALHAEIDRYNPDLLILAGFMSKFDMRPRWINRVMNIHPALIPAFCGQDYYGHRVHEAVLEYGAKVSGATVHFVNDEYDAGPIILQKTIEVLDDDTPDSLAARVHEVENEIYPRAIQLFAEGRLRVEGRKVRILPAD